jgi:hypothetical protein
MVWNPSMEARPEYINKLHGTNQEARVCMVLFPPARQRRPPIPTVAPLAPIPAGSLAFQTPSANNPWPSGEPERQEEWEQRDAERKAVETNEENVEEIVEDECRFCAYVAPSMDHQCPCSTDAGCIDLPADDFPETQEGGWKVRRNVATFARKFNNSHGTFMDQSVP